MICTSCSQVVKPIIVSDIDGTLSQYHHSITVFSAKYFDTAPPTFPYDGSVPFREYLGLTQTEHRQMKLAYRQGGNKRFVKAFPGAQELILDCRMILNAEIWVATTRPWQRLDNIDPDTREWLRRNNIEIDGLLYGDDKYEQLVETVDRKRIVAVFEDLPEQIAFGKLLGLPMFQIHREHNDHNRHYGGSLQDGYRFARRQIEQWRRDYEDK